MRAVLTTSHGDRDVLRFVADYPVPVPQPGEVLVRVAATAVNFHDVFTRRGMPGIRIPLPIVTGSDIAGTIAATGDGVEGWMPGQRVLIDPIAHDGSPDMLGETRDGGRAELVAVPSGQLIAVPDAVSLEAAAALPLAYGTAYRMLLRRGQVSAGESVLVLGASGGVGAACVQLARMQGATVVACASSQEKLARLADIGADHLVDYAQAPMVEAVRELFGKPRVNGAGGVDVAVNFTGGDTWGPTQRCVRKGGRILTCGATAGYEVATDLRYLWSFEHDVRGADGWSREDLVALLELVANGRLDPLIDRVLPLKEAAEAERMLEERLVVGKVVLVP